jgi:hypothetical protein
VPQNIAGIIVWVILVSLWLFAMAKGLVGGAVSRRSMTRRRRLILSATIAALGASIFEIPGMRPQDWSTSIYLLWLFIYLVSAFGCVYLLLNIRSPLTRSKVDWAIFVAAGVACGAVLSSILAFGVHALPLGLVPISLSWEHALGGSLTGLFVSVFVGVDHDSFPARLDFREPTAGCGE